MGHFLYADYKNLSLQNLSGEQFLNDKDVISYITKYEVNGNAVNGLNGEFGSTMQFWLKYVEMIETLLQFHFALKTSNLYVMYHTGSIINNTLNS